MNDKTKTNVPVVKIGNKLRSSKDQIDGSGEKKEKTLATEKHPTIQAIIHALFRFEKIEQANSRLEAIKNNFIISSRLPKDGNENALKLWINGYKLTEAEKKNGYIGNYAAIKIKQIEGKYTLIAEKQDIALKYHPQRKRPKQKHPDWGHPALRIVKKGMAFDSVNEAHKILNQLHEEYPEVSIPNPNKLYIMIYGNAEGNTPIQKFVLEIKPSSRGGFFIEYTVNKHVKGDAANVTSAKEKKEVKGERKIQGKFTALAELNKAKKKAKDKRKEAGKVKIKKQEFDQ